MWACLFLWAGLAPLGPTTAVAGPFGGGNPIETIEEGLSREPTEEELAEQARLEEFNNSMRGRNARVVVLQWQGSDTDYTNEALKRNIINRIARPDAKFYPEVDLYQKGRQEQDRSVRPGDQRASVPDDVIPVVLDAVDDISQIPYDALDEQEWRLRAEELRQLGDELWFLDRTELMEPLFLLYTYTGYAAENTNDNSPPYYTDISGVPVNYYYYLAGALAYQDPALMSKLSNQDLYASVQNYKDQLESGRFQQLDLSFDDREGEFDGEQFLKDFVLYINGSPIVITDPDGILTVPLGRVDVYLERPGDGHGLSDRVETVRLTDRYYFVRQNAWKTMGIGFQEQLMEHPYECNPDLDGDILTYLSIYAKIHPTSEIYIAVPKGGSTAPGRIFLWRWNRATSQLVLVQDNTGGFPIRFAGVFSSGLAFSTFSFTPPEDAAFEDVLLDQEPGSPPNFGALAGSVLDFAPVIDGPPLDFQLRGHYNRLMMGVGIQFKVGLNGPDSYADLYQVNGRDNHQAVELATADCVEGDDGLVGCAGTGTGITGTKVVNQLALRERSLQRLVYATIGVVLGSDAAVGFGPRGYLRFGWYNAPHAVDMTAHLGLTPKLGGEPEGLDRPGRVQMLADFDVFAGVLAPYQDSLYVSNFGFMAVGQPIATFGFTAGLGTTF